MVGAVTGLAQLDYNTGTDSARLPVVCSTVRNLLVRADQVEGVKDAA